MQFNQKHKADFLAQKLHEFPLIQQPEPQKQNKYPDKITINLQKLQQDNHFQKADYRQGYDSEVGIQKQNFQNSENRVFVSQKSKDEFINQYLMQTQKSSDKKKSDPRKTEFQFITSSKLLKKPQRPPQVTDNNIIEKTIEQFKIQKQIMDYGETQKQDTDQFFSNIKGSLSKTYSQDEILRKLKRGQTQGIKGVKDSEQTKYRSNLLRRLDEKVQSINQPNFLTYQWQSPFLIKKDEVSKTQIRRVMADAYVKGLQELDAYKPREKNLTPIKGEVQFNREGQDDEIIIAAIQMHKVFKGYGYKFKSILDKDKEEWRVYQRSQGNPKYLNRGEVLLGLKNKQNKYLSMTQEWNKLLSMEKLQKTMFSIKKSEQKKWSPDNAKSSSCSQFRSFEGFKQKIASLSKQASYQKQLKEGSSLTQQATPVSIIQNKPQFVLRNSTYSNSSSRKDLELFGVKENESHKSPRLENLNVPVNLTQSISKDTLLTFFPIFWALIRKEDAIVERIIWALSRKDRVASIDFEGFKKFYSIFVFQDSEYEERYNFVLDLLLGENQDEISFIEIQGFINILCSKIDLMITKSLESPRIVQQELLSDQLLENIVEKIHRPQIIQKSVIIELLDENQLPVDTIIRLLYDDTNI